MTRSPSASSGRRRVHRGGFSQGVAFCLIQREGRGKQKREGDGWMDGCRGGEFDWGASEEGETGRRPLIDASKRRRRLADLLKLICNVFRLSPALMRAAHGSRSLPHDQWQERGKLHLAIKTLLTRNMQSPAAVSDASLRQLRRGGGEGGVVRKIMN